MMQQPIKELSPSATAYPTAWVEGATGERALQGL